MKYSFFLFLSVCFGQFFFAQSQNDVYQVDDKYREDQFYISVTYNLLSQKPDGVSQSGFSSGFHFGFIRDMPINKKRNLAVGLGLGISTNSYNQNLLIQEDTDENIQFSVLDDDDYTKNKFSTFLIEIPFELRWRTSTPDSYKFWRIYTGVKVGYLLFNRTKYEGSLYDNFKLYNISAFNNFQYAFTFSAGYGNYSVYLNLPLNPIFDNQQTISDAAVDMSAVKIGLIFYIL